MQKYKSMLFFAFKRSWFTTGNTSLGKQSRKKSLLRTTFFFLSSFLLPPSSSSSLDKGCHENEPNTNSLETLLFCALTLCRFPFLHFHFLKSFIEEGLFEFELPPLLFFLFRFTATTDLSYPLSKTTATLSIPRNGSFQLQQFEV
jgi:hypothetical protein